MENKHYSFPVTFEELMQIEVALKQNGNKDLLAKVKQFTDEHFSEQLDSEHNSAA